MSKTEFSIARDFSVNPGPRFIRQGAHSGEALRRKLVTLLETVTGDIIIDLDGTTGFGSSFLDEAFGGLVRNERKAKDEIRRRFHFKSDLDPSYIDDIFDSIDRAEPTVH